MAASNEEGSVLDCPICLEKLSNPKYLPCLHTFCELCIQSFIDSSISDCIVNRRNISFDCPVCRRANQAPSQNISAKEWAEQLPKNHLLLAIKDLYGKGNNTESKVLCDSCTQNGEQIIATLRCKQCRDNLCEACCKFIHKRVKSFSFHTIVDLRSAYSELGTTTDFGNCLVHSDRSIEVYCFDHGELGCSFCLTTKHKNCRTVLSLDEIAENDLEKQSKSFIRETKEIRDLTSSAIQDANKNITELNTKKMEVLQNIAQTIEKIKRRLDSLSFGMDMSLRRSHEGQISELTSVLTTLNDFDAILVESENTASTIMQSGSRKQVFIALEKMKIQISDKLKVIKTMRKQMKGLALKWSFNETINNFNKMAKLGDFEYTMTPIDIVAQIEKHFDVIKEEVNPIDIGNY